MADKTRQEQIDDQEKELDNVRRLFDLYFQGLERFPPKMRYATLKATLMRMRAESARWNTADRFRVGMLQQRFSTYDRMWTRQLQELEDGTHRRDKFRVRRMREADADIENMPTQQAARGATAGAEARQAARASAETGNADEARMRKLYAVYMKAKERTGEKANLSYEGMVRQLNKQVPVLQKKHNCDRIEFKVVLKDGKALLKAVPKP